MTGMAFVQYFFRRIWISVRHLPVTVEYPFVSKAIPPLSRTRLKNLFSDCIGCLECESKCPLHAISIRSEPYGTGGGRPMTSRGVMHERSVSQFVVDYSRCVTCGICVNVCPTQSLDFDRSFYPPQMTAPGLTLDLVHMPRTMRKGEP